jgi:hypothetical protein
VTEPMDVDEALRMGEIALLAFEARPLRGPLREGACTDAASVVASLRARLRRERERYEECLTCLHEQALESTRLEGELAKERARLRREREAIAEIEAFLHRPDTHAADKLTFASAKLRAILRGEGTT